MKIMTGGKPEFKIALQNDEYGPMLDLWSAGINLTMYLLSGSCFEKQITALISHLNLLFFYKESTPL